MDVDHCFRKESYLECVTPSNQIPIPPGNSYDIYQTLEKIAEHHPNRDLFGPELESIQRAKDNVQFPSFDIAIPLSFQQKRVRVQMAKSMQEIMNILAH